MSAIYCFFCNAATEKLYHPCSFNRLAVALGSLRPGSSGRTCPGDHYKTPGIPESFTLYVINKHCSKINHTGMKRSEFFRTFWKKVYIALWKVVR